MDPITQIQLLKNENTKPMSSSPSAVASGITTMHGLLRQLNEMAVENEQLKRTVCHLKSQQFATESALAAAEAELYTVLHNMKAIRVVAPSVHYKPVFAGMHWDFVMADIRSVPGISPELIAIIDKVYANHKDMQHPIQGVVDAVAIWAYMEPKESLKASSILLAAANQDEDLCDVMARVFATE
jgi:hypothetical protein